MSDINFPVGLNPPFAEWKGLIFEEDEAMMIALKGMFVGANSGKQLNVPVYWDTPQRQMNPQDQSGNQGNVRGVPQLTYPNVMVSFVDMRRDASREHRNYSQVTVYERNSGNPGPMSTIEMPIPLSLFYQVSVNASNMQHVRQLTNILTFQFLMQRFGTLICPSGTVRRLDIVSGPKPAQQLNANNQRIFRHVWVVSVSSEIEYGSEVANLVEEVLLSVSEGGVAVETGPAVQTENITVTELS